MEILNRNVIMKKIRKSDELPKNFEFCGIMYDLITTYNSLLQVTLMNAVAPYKAHKNTPYLKIISRVSDGNRHCQPSCNTTV